MLLIKDASEIFLPGGVQKNASIIVENGKIKKIGKNLDEYEIETIDAKGKTILPGFVDCHTHAVFAGSREFELEMKLKGASYEEIAAHGGGISYTVEKTRNATFQQLFSESKKRLDRMLEYGTTTAEVKSGYGLDTESEIKILDVAKELNGKHAVDIVPTFLGAHAVPPEMGRDEYVDLVINKMIPKVAEKKIAKFCDVFCERGYFTVEDARKILQTGKEYGMIPKIHADEFSSCGGAELAADMGAASADHLLMSSINGIREMAKADVTAVLLPPVPFSLMQDRYAPARRMINEGARVALATDLNPNCWTENMQFVVQLACFKMGMTPREAIESATINAAKAIGMEKDIGSIEEGKKADLIVIDAPSHVFIPYHFGVNLVKTVIKNGKTI